jgi:hypothetical protein
MPPLSFGSMGAATAFGQDFAQDNAGHHRRQSHPLSGYAMGQARAGRSRVRPGGRAVCCPSGVSPRVRVPPDASALVHKGADIEEEANGVIGESSRSWAWYGDILPKFTWVNC